MYSLSCNFVTESDLPVVVNDSVGACGKKCFNLSDSEYSLAPTHDLVRFWRSKGQGHSGDKVIHVDSGG